MDEIWKSLVATGPIGAILVYYLWKITPSVEAYKAQVLDGQKEMKDEICDAVRKLEEAFDRATMTDLCRLAASPLVASEVKQKVAEIMADIKAAETSRAALMNEANGIMTTQDKPHS